jgi:superfamily II DNA or RNA helicase
VLIDRIKTGEMLLERNPDWVFVSGGMKTTDRQKEYADISDMDNKVVVATYGVAAVGINIPRIFNLVMLEPGKSFVRVIQSIGRGIRKAEDKDYVQIVDITSNLKYSKKHLTARKQYYAEQKFRHSVTKVQYK